MIFREATISDIIQMQRVRQSVKENMLSDWSLVKDADYEEFLVHRGKGWVAEEDSVIMGFAIADLQDENIWALFVKPEYESLGLGRKLHDMMLIWYFDHKEKVWLGTSPGTRAERFYRKAGWRQVGMHGKNELKFEMLKEDWKAMI